MLEPNCKFLGSKPLSFRISPPGVVGLPIAVLPIFSRFNPRLRPAGAFLVSSYSYLFPNGRLAKALDNGILGLSALETGAMTG